MQVPVVTKCYHSITKTALAAALICFLVYVRALDGHFVFLDDQLYVLNNSAIRNLDRNLLSWAFSPTEELWFPLTWISLAIDHYFWGLNPYGYHLTNNILHAANTGLVVLIADQFYSDRLAAIDCSEKLNSLYPWILLVAGLLFGIHPLRVESVAWVAERKDVLNGLFSLGSILYYLRYVRRKNASGSAPGGTKEYLISLTFFALSLLAKPVSVVIPVMFMVLDWYPLQRLQKGRITRVALEKIPFLFLSVALSTFTIYLAHKRNMLVSIEALSIFDRFALAGNALFEYGRWLFYPAGIAPLHLIPDPIPLIFGMKALLTLLIIVCLVIYSSIKKPWILATLLCFVLPLLPVLGLFQNGVQAHASRYTYLPAFAPSIAAAMLLAHGIQSLPGKRKYIRFFGLSLLVLLLTGYTVMTVRLIAVWKDTGTLWTRQIEIQPLGRAYKDRGIYYYSIGRYDEALEDFSTAFRIAKELEWPDYFNLYAYHGETQRAAGRYNEAVKDFTDAIAMYPHPVYYYFRGCSLKALGRLKEAEEDFHRAGNQTGPLDWFHVE
jgi:protein O-mannosyl-transferase